MALGKKQLKFFPRSSGATSIPAKASMTTGRR
jgi:hypothetical protein